MTFHVRRKDREITDTEKMRAVLRSTKYLVSLSHGYDPQKNCLYFHCAPEGKKLVYAQVNNKVWGQAVLDYGVTEECDYAYTSVHFSGTISIINGQQEKQHAIEILVRQLSANPENKLSKIKPEKLAKTTMGRIDIDYITGKQHLNLDAFPRKVN
jgi:nitroimidazol reductase NimA-like FMN-containing flavoprotein (pyridoxamine 5'-phosphate oxidase superfamily)